MHVYFIGIGGTAIGPLALIAKQAGYDVSGSDKQDSNYLAYLKSQGIEDISIGSDAGHIESLHRVRPIELIVYSSAVSIENPDHPQISFAREHGIKAVKRDGLLNKIIQDNGLKLIAVAGTHGKTTTTAMAIWTLKQAGVNISYSVGAKIPFGDMGHFSKESEYFIYECDEFDRNFLAFQPYLSIITGIDHDHHEQYPTPEAYREAFAQFLDQSENKILWQEDADKLELEASGNAMVLSESEPILNMLSLPGLVNRKDACLVIEAASKLEVAPVKKLSGMMNAFPGVSRRFEKITDGLYSDYAHTIPKIEGCLQVAREVSDNVVIVYEPLTNRRQYFIRDEYKNLFKGVKKLYWVPSYLAREDPNRAVITPRDFIGGIDEPLEKEASELDEKLKASIKSHIEKGDTVVCLSGGGGGSLDEWLRSNFKNP